MPVSSRILAIDDNPTNLAIIDESFGGEFDLRLVDNGDEAVMLAPTFRPDVILLDVTMPPPDGYAVCTELRRHDALRSSKIIMVSARTTVAHRMRGYEAGADDYICKPFYEEELRAKVIAALHSTNLCRSAQEDVDAICSATGDVLELLTSLRDTETGEHVARIRSYSELLARELQRTSPSLGIDGSYITQLLRASALHDIGKVAIPDAILRKPGRLTDVERRQMQQHTIIGEQILTRLSRYPADSGLFAMAAQVARSHHECFDGSGYPDGLLGESIPLPARIVKVADVFDAMTSARVYKASCDPTAVRHYIVQGAGAAFDPLVVNAMNRVFDRFLESCDSTRDTSQPLVSHR